MDSQRFNELINLLDNTSGSVNGNAKNWPGGYGFFSAEGTFGGATVKLQFQSPRGTWFDVGSAVALVAPGLGGFFLPPGNIRAVSSAGGSAIYSYAYPMITVTQTGD